MDDSERQAAQRAKVEGPQGPEARKRAMWRLSPWVPRDLGWVFELAQPIGMVLIFIVSTGILYLRYFANGRHPVEGGSRMGGSFVFDPKTEGYDLFYVFIAVLLLAIGALVWAVLAKRAGRRAYAEERAYAQALPFSVLGYPAVVGENESEYAIDIFFVDAEPDRARLVQLVTDIDGFIKDTEGERRHPPGLHFAAIYPPLEASGNNAQRFVGTVRALTGALTVLHAQYPIDRIELTGSSSERFDAAVAARKSQ